VTPKIDSGRRLSRCSEKDLPEYRYNSAYGTSKALKIFRKSSQKGISPSNRKRLKTRVATRASWVFRKGGL
jgi:hypothetical protein